MRTGYFLLSTGIPSHRRRCIDPLSVKHLRTPSDEPVTRTDCRLRFEPPCAVRSRSPKSPTSSPRFCFRFFFFFFLFSIPTRSCCRVGRFFALGLLSRAAKLRNAAPTRAVVHPLALLFDPSAQNSQRCLMVSQLPPPWSAARWHRGETTELSQRRFYFIFYFFLVQSRI